jgi:hypothetical protein
MAGWVQHGAGLWIEDGPAWTGRTATADPTAPDARDRVAPLASDGRPLWFREPGPPCPAGALSAPCPWELRWPADARTCPEPVLAPWWQAFGPWTELGTAVAPTVVWSHALFAVGPRDPGVERRGVALDPMRGTCVAAQSHLGSRGLAIDARHHLRHSSVARSGRALGLASPTLADLKDLAATAATRVELVEVRAFVPLDAIAAITATRRFSDTRPLLGPERRAYDEHGHGPLDSAKVIVSLHDGWRRHEVTLYVDGEGAGWPYQTAAFEAWVTALVDAVAATRPVQVDEADSSRLRWTRRVTCDGTVPLCAPAGNVLSS